MMVWPQRISCCALVLALGGCDTDPPPPPAKQRVQPKAASAAHAEAPRPTGVPDPGPPPEEAPSGPPNLMEFVQRDDGTCVLEERCADGTENCERLPPRKVDCPEGEGSPLRDAEGEPLEFKVLPKGEMVEAARPDASGEPPAKPLDEEPRSTTRPKKPAKGGHGRCVQQLPPPCEGCEAPPPKFVDCSELADVPK